MIRKERNDMFEIKLAIITFVHSPSKELEHGFHSNFGTLHVAMPSFLLNE